jgi:hypothetical protein
MNGARERINNDDPTLRGRGHSLSSNLSRRTRATNHSDTIYDREGNVAFSVGDVVEVMVLAENGSLSTKGSISVVSTSTCAQSSVAANEQTDGEGIVGVNGDFHINPTSKQIDQWLIATVDRVCFLLLFFRENISQQLCFLVALRGASKRVISC